MKGSPIGAPTARSAIEAVLSRAETSEGVIVMVAQAPEVEPELERVAVFDPGDIVRDLDSGADLRRRVRSPGLLEVGCTANQALGTAPYVLTLGMPVIPMLLSMVCELTSNVVAR